METKNNMICDLETGICGPGGDDTATMEFIDFSAQKKTVELYYVTDPICSHCWALEPVLRKFVDQYGHYFNMHTLMGGLLENWDGFADVSNGISSPQMLLVTGEKLVNTHVCQLMELFGTIIQSNRLLSLPECIK